MGTRPRATLWFFRLAALLAGLASVLQPVLAGLYLSGNFDVLSEHAENADLVVLFGLLQLIAAICYWRPGGGRGAPALFALLLFGCQLLQTVVGYRRLLAVHIPLGVAVVAGAVVLAVWVWRPAAARGRRSHP